MTTALASQLAQIRAHSTNPLDLKAQKKAHSRSLLFEPDVAANQDFESLYQICYEGFQELCSLDSRFAGFANSIFSEQSKHEDRTQMTAAQNQRLDVVLEEFLHLVGSKLLLKPALKAVEWLVRRFRLVIILSASASSTSCSFHLGSTKTTLRAWYSPFYRSTQLQYSLTCCQSYPRRYHLFSGFSILMFAPLRTHRVMQSCMLRSSTVLSLSL